MHEKIIFMGTPIFAAKILEHLLSSGYSVDLVVTQPDRKIGRKQIITPTPVKQVATSHGIPVFQPENIKVDFAPIIELKPNIIITAAYGQIVPEQVLTAPSEICINVHGSLLPKYRGGAPIHYSVLNGDAETGVTIMQMVQKMDAGAIISQGKFPIDIDDTTSDVHDKMITCAQDLLIDTLPSIINGDYSLVEQDLSKVTFSPNISKEQELINWKCPMLTVHNQIRGLSSWPGGYTTLEGRRFKIYKSSLTDKLTSLQPGSIVIEEKRMYVACNDFLLELLIVQPDGKKQMPVSSYLNAHTTFTEMNFV